MTSLDSSASLAALSAAAPAECTSDRCDTNSAVAVSAAGRSRAYSSSRYSPDTARTRTRARIRRNSAVSESESESVSVSAPPPPDTAPASAKRPRLRGPIGVLAEASPPLPSLLGTAAAVQRSSTCSGRSSPSRAWECARRRARRSATVVGPSSVAGDITPSSTASRGSRATPPETAVPLQASGGASSLRAAPPHSRAQGDGTSVYQDRPSVLPAGPSDPRRLPRRRRPCSNPPLPVATPRRPRARSEA